MVQKSKQTKKPAPKKAVKSTTKKAVEEMEVKKIPTFSRVKGMRDILPQDDNIWKKMRSKRAEMVKAYGYSYIETPLLESANLFVRSVGKGTDIVEKEMYVFDGVDSFGKTALRPEATASVVRAYIENGLHTLTQPVKVWYEGPMFRREKPQANRYREFHQFGCEVIGDNHNPAMDAEIISVAYNFIKDLGIDVSIHLNSIGTLNDRERYLVELVSYLRSKRSYLCVDCKRRINKNPLRVLDCKMKGCKSVIEEAPHIVDWLGDKSKEFFMSVLEYLDELGLPYKLDYKLVRGLDYYTDTVFELFPVENDKEDNGSQSALAAGGRYDKLVEHLGGQPATACGFGIGLERVANKLKEKIKNGEAEEESEIKIFFAQLGIQAKRRALGIIKELRKDGIFVGHNLAKSALKAQLEIADKMQTPYTLILGQREVQDSTIIIRDMESGIQEIIDQKKLKTRLKRILSQLV
ncbi:MAG: histidine--tRNA ligase [Candidatus Magasanikbacteria bacterium]|nr:histidine--tRNA ligase [Candidatus Magasanikbacteria bacterium]